MAERFYLDFSYTITSDGGANVSLSALYCINIQQLMISSSGSISPWRGLIPMLLVYANNGYEIYIRLYRKKENGSKISVIEIPTIIGPYAPNTIYSNIAAREDNPEDPMPPLARIYANYDFTLPGVESNDSGRRYFCNFNFLCDPSDINSCDARIGVSIVYNSGGNL